MTLTFRKYGPCNKKCKKVANCAPTPSKTEGGSFLTGGGGCGRPLDLRLLFPINFACVTRCCENSSMGTFSYSFGTRENV